MRILMVLTSHDQLGNTGRKTGFWLEEFAAPYFVFTDAGRILHENAPDRAAGPRVFLAACAGGTILRMRHDVGEEAARAIELLVADEQNSPSTQSGSPPGQGSPTPITGSTPRAISPA